MARKRYETRIKEESLKQLKFIKAHYDFNYMNEALEKVIEDKYNEIFGGKNNDMEHTND